MATTDLDIQDYDRNDCCIHDGSGTDKGIL